jgi:hypothetical protein
VNLLKAVRTLLYGADKADFPPQTSAEFKAVYEGDRNAKPLAITARGLVDEEGILVLYGKNGEVHGNLPEAGTTFGRSLLDLPNEGALRAALGVSPVVEITGNMTLTEEYHGETLTNVDTGGILTLDAPEGTELLVICEASNSVYVTPPIDVPILLNGSPATSVECSVVGGYIHLKRTSAYWFVLGSRDFGTAA